MLLRSRDAQFRYIARQVRAAQRRGQPAISVDTKKKELVGPFKNGGRAWRPSKSPQHVRVHDFVIPGAAGGKAIPFHASVRIRLGSGNQVKDKDGNVIGIHTTVTIKKNKVAAPFRKMEFDIIFGKGIVEDDYLFDEARSHCKESGPVKRKGHVINISGEGAWKELSVVNEKTGEVVVEKKFYKSEFGGLMKDTVYGPFIMEEIGRAHV